MKQPQRLLGTKRRKGPLEPFRRRLIRFDVVISHFGLTRRPGRMEITS